MARYTLILLTLFTLTLGVIIISSANLKLAFTIGTGLGVGQLQQKINSVQSRAIKGQITTADKEFLELLYRTLAYGAQITFLLPESARLMHHYLDGGGKPTSIDASLYTQSPRVIEKMRIIRKQISSHCTVGGAFVSERFDMGHSTPLDAHFALYFGTIKGELVAENNKKFIQWTADMPWKWPTYADIKKTYGTFYKEIFPLPNALSLLGLGQQMWLPNALGGELEKRGLAKSFDIKTIWTEISQC